MPLEAGQTLLHYRVVEKIGEGGMGVVWRAEDKTLGREVAIKLLPAEFAENHERLVRLEREAKLLASLNHPNVAAIHGLEEDRGLRFLVLELIPGQSLRAMLAAGAIPIDEALDIARQIAEGLEAAHAAGVIHRDLKPENVCVTPDGTAKVLDFGLAKGPAIDSSSSGTHLSQSPTMTNVATQDGVILGTAPYMSPEQARGKTVDRRTDIWSLGCLLYECLTGTRTFHGDSVADILSLILQRDPDWSALPDRTPPRVRELVERCLERNPRNRLQHIGDARIELQRTIAGREWTTSGVQAAVAPPTSVRGSLRWFAVFVLGVLAGAAALWGTLRLGDHPSAENGTALQTMRFSITAPDGVRLSRPHVSPDSTRIVYRSFDVNAENRKTRVLMRRFDSYEAVPVDGAEGYIALAFSPDGEWLAFVAPRAPGSDSYRIFKSPVDGGTPPLTVGDWPEKMSNRLVWLAGNVLVAASYLPNRLYRFPLDGSPQPDPVALEIADGLDFVPTDGLPDGRNVLGWVSHVAESGARIDVGMLDLETAVVRTLVREGDHPSWSPTGHVVFSRAGNVLALPFDVASLEATGSPLALMSGLHRPIGLDEGYFDLSRTGTLVYQGGSASPGDTRLMILDRQGLVVPWSEERYFLDGNFRISRDGQRVAVEIFNRETQLPEIWISDVGRRQLRPLATELGLGCAYPVWFPDGSRVVYGCAGLNDVQVLVQAADGSQGPTVLWEFPLDELRIPVDVSPDGAWLAEVRQVEDGLDLFLVPMTNDTRGGSEAAPLVEDLSGNWVTFSPDGRLIAFTRDESGKDEIYVGELLDGRLGRVHRVSNDGGRGFPAWRRVDSQSLELVYNNAGGRLMSALIETVPEVRISEPQPLSIDLTALRSKHWRLLPDGRFLFTQGPEQEEVESRIHVVVNFHEEMKRTLAAAR